jgi:hypothetical protein
MHNFDPSRSFPARNMLAHSLLRVFAPFLFVAAALAVNPIEETWGDICENANGLTRRDQTSVGAGANVNAGVSVSTAAHPVTVSYTQSHAVAPFGRTQPG